MCVRFSNMHIIVFIVHSELLWSFCHVVIKLHVHIHQQSPHLIYTTIHFQLGYTGNWFSCHPTGHSRYVHIFLAQFLCYIYRMWDAFLSKIVCFNIDYKLDLYFWIKCVFYSKWSKEKILKFNTWKCFQRVIKFKGLKSLLKLSPWMLCLGTCIHKHCYSVV